MRHQFVQVVGLAVNLVVSLLATRLRSHLRNRPQYHRRFRLDVQQPRLLTNQLAFLLNPAFSPALLPLDIRRPAQQGVLRPQVLNPLGIQRMNQNLLKFPLRSHLSHRVGILLRCLRVYHRGNRQTNQREARRVSHLSCHHLSPPVIRLHNLVVNRPCSRPEIQQ